MSIMRKGALALALMTASAGFAHSAAAAEARVAVAGTMFSMPVRSLQARKFETVVRQAYDFSCGSAALATLLTYHYDRPATEEQVFDAMWAVGDQESIRAKGFSLLDMKLYLESVGLKADGYRVPLNKLKEVGVPTIALILRKGYAHFVVLRGIADDYVVLGDPSLGAITVPREEFEKQWNGIAFAIGNDAQVAREHFNLVRDLPLQRRAYLGMALPRASLAAITILLPGQNEF
jgi:predicted double-glycine peptidase